VLLGAPRIDADRLRLALGQGWPWEFGPCGNGLPCGRRTRTLHSGIACFTLPSSPLPPSLPKLFYQLRLGIPCGASHESG